MELGIKTVNIIVKNKSTTIFYGVNSHQPKKWHQNVQNFAVKPLAIPLEFEHFDFISKVNKNTDHGKKMSICYWRLGRIKINFSDVHKLWLFWWKFLNPPLG